ncbi:hypothetical protein BGZ95_010540 [Linnemannia exigua]|uniref:Uncharacterized protein n=1 Tax=Linnemannia exigua TaxID=604196 RepID=A0AAD4DB93_9FUNG|nr:hypothetical protein BGZ95_010540 [Linnemannia exigua]
MSNSNIHQPIVVVVDGHKKTNALIIHVTPSQTIGELRDFIKTALSLHPKFSHLEHLTLYLWKIFLNPPPRYKTLLGISSDVVSLDRAYLRWKLQLAEKVGDVLDRSVYDVSLGTIDSDRVMNLFVLLNGKRVNEAIQIEISTSSTIKDLRHLIKDKMSRDSNYEYVNHIDVEKMVLRKAILPCPDSFSSVQAMGNEVVRLDSSVTSWRLGLTEKVDDVFGEGKCFPPDGLRFVVFEFDN